MIATFSLEKINEKEKKLSTPFFFFFKVPAFYYLKPITVVNILIT